MAREKDYSLINLFKEARASSEGKFLQDPDIAVVGRLPDLELKTKSGIITPRYNTHVRSSSHAEEPCYVIVLDPGEGRKGLYESEEEGNSGPLVAAGNILQVGRNTVRWYSAFGTIVGYSIGDIMATPENIWRLWDDYDTFKKWFSYFNGPMASDFNLKEEG